MIGIARDLGLDIKKLAADMKNREIGKIIDRNYALADALGIEGTPAFIIGDKLYPGALDSERLKTLIVSGCFLMTSLMTMSRVMIPIGGSSLDRALGLTAGGR